MNQVNLLASSVFWIAMAAPAAAQVDTSLVRLRVYGIASASPQLNSILGAEVGGSAINSEVQKERELLAAEATRAAGAGARQKALMQDAAKLQKAVDERFQSIVVTANGSITRTAVTLGQTSSLAMDTFIAAQQDLEDATRKQLFDAAAAKNRATLDALLTVELAKLPKATLKKWDKRLDAGDMAVLDEVLASGQMALKKDVLEAMDGAAALLLRSQLQAQLGAALENAQGVSSSERAALQKVAKEGITVLSQTAVVINALNGVGGPLEQSKSYLNAYKGAAESMHALGNLVAQRVGVGQALNPAQQAAMRTVVQLGHQFLGGSSVATADVSLALDRSGLVFPNKAQLLTTFDRLSDLRKPELLSQGLSDVQGYLALASSLGVKVDSKVGKAVATAQVAATVAMSFASGNYLGAVAGVSGMFGGKSMGFGGGGADAAAAARHAEIMGALREIKALQLKTLRAIEDLSVQLKEATEMILTKLDGIQDSVEYLLAVQQFNEIHRPLTLCREFIGSAKKAGMKEGYFPSYQVRKNHFDVRAQPLTPNYIECSRMLTKNLSLVNSPTAPTLPPTMWNVTEVRNARKGKVGAASSIWKYDRAHYFPMVAYTVSALNLGTPVNPEKTEFQYREPCSTRFIGALAAAPASLHHVHYARMKCDEASGPGPEEGLRLLNAGFGGRLLPAGPLLDVPINSALIGELSYYAIFFQAYQPLITGDNPPYNLLGEADIAKGAPMNATRETGGRINLASALDLVNAAIAQQTLLSGLYVASHAADVLHAAAFGRSAPALPNALKTAAASEGCAPHRHLQEAAYHTTVCMLIRHPDFARNVATHLVLADASYASLSLEEYQNLFDAGNATASDVLVSLPKLARYMVYRDKRWFIEVKSPLLSDYEPLLLPMPSASVLREGVVSYPETMRSLLVARASLLQEIGEELRSSGSATLWTEARRPESTFLPPAPGVSE